MEKVKLASDTNTSFTKILGIVFIIIGIVGAIGVVIMYNDVSYLIRDEVKITYLAIGSACLFGNLAIGMVLITLDRIANAIESK